MPHVKIFHITSGDAVSPVIARAFPYPSAYALTELGLFFVDVAEKSQTAGWNPKDVEPGSVPVAAIVAFVTEINSQMGTVVTSGSSVMIRA